MGRPCITENCENIVSDNSHLDACSACRAAINRWKRRSPAEIYNRRQQLTKYGARMEVLIDEDVVDIKSKRKRDEMQERKNVVHITTRLFRVPPERKSA
jgi:predicted anti-sigma-YlaC factor YlaD